MQGIKLDGKHNLYKAEILPTRDLWPNMSHVSKRWKYSTVFLLLRLDFKCWQGTCRWSKTAFTSLQMWRFASCHWRWWRAGDVNVYLNSGQGHCLSFSLWHFVASNFPCWQRTQEKCGWRPSPERVKSLPSKASVPSEEENAQWHNLAPYIRKYL